MEFLLPLGNTSDVTFEENTTLEYNNPTQYNNCRDNPGSIINSQTAFSVFRTVNCGFMPSLFLIGAPSNILSLIVFYRQGLRDRMNLCLFSLALTDLLYVAAVFIKVSFCFITILHPDEEDFWRFTLTKHTLYFVYGSGYSSGCLTMIIAVERCVCVMFPMKAATLISTKTMGLLVIATVILTQGLSSLYIIKEKVITVKDDVTGKYRVSLANTELFLNNSIFKIIENIVLSFISFSNFTVVLFATFTTVVSLRSAMRWRKSKASSSVKGQTVLVKMLVVVSCIYILCTAPNVVLALTRFSVPEFSSSGRYCDLFHSTHYIGQLLVMINSSINFFVYITMSSRFRLELTTLFKISVVKSRVHLSNSK